MKKLFIITIAVMFVSMSSIALSNGQGGMSKDEVIGIISKFLSQPQGSPVFSCPKSHISDQDKCFVCHTTPGFKVKEIDPEEGFTYPYKARIILGENGEQIGHYTVNEISGPNFNNAMMYLYNVHKLKHIIVEVSSYGGSLFDAWDMQSTMSQYERLGVVFETRCSSYAMSAGFIILVAGTQGNRYVSSKAELMFHELWTFEMFKLSTPSSAEDQAKILRHIQDTASEWLSTKSNMTKEEIDAKIAKREWWMSGREALEMGFVDGFLDKD